MIQHQNQVNFWFSNQKLSRAAKLWKARKKFSFGFSFTRLIALQIISVTQSEQSLYIISTKNIESDSTLISTLFQWFFLKQKRDSTQCLWKYNCTNSFVLWGFQPVTHQLSPSLKCTFIFLGIKKRPCKVFNLTRKKCLQVSIVDCFHF